MDPFYDKVEEFHHKLVYEHFKTSRGWLTKLR